MLMLELRLVLKSMPRLDHNMDVDAIDHTTDVATEDVDVVAVVVVMVAMDTVDAIEEATGGDLILFTLYRTKMTL